MVGTRSEIQGDMVVAVSGVTRLAQGRPESLGPASQCSLRLEPAALGLLTLWSKA